jgi:hypothetical protein
MSSSNDKKLTDRQLLGGQGTSLIDLLVSKMGFVWRPTAQHDTGIDGEIEARDGATGRMTGLLVKVQSKALSSLANETDEGFDYWPEERDMRYWRGHNLPVILVVSRPATAEVYWQSVRDQMATPDAKRFHFVKARDRLNEDARGRLVQLAQSASPGSVAPALAKHEELTSNLLPVVRLPERLYLAETKFRSGKEIGDLLKETNERNAEDAKSDSTLARPDLRVEFVLKNGRILTVRDLTDPRYEFLCDRGTVEDFPTSEWALANAPDKQRDFVHLMNQCLREMLRSMPEHLWFDRDSRCFFFPPSRDRKPYDYAYRGAKKETAREVFKERINKSKGHIMGYRHSAMMAQFYRFDASWYLEVTPTYFFTKDGAQKSKWHEEWLKGIKELEKNNAVRGQLLMWADLLAEVPDLLGDGYPFLRFGPPVAFATDHGLDDSSWAVSESSGKSGVNDGSTPLFELL